MADFQSKIDSKKVQEVFTRGLEALGFPDQFSGKKGGAPCFDSTVLALAQLTEILFVWSKKINLTGHLTPERIASRLIMDALALAKEIPEFQSLADLGSGAGFPGLPFAVLFPECEFLLVESRERRVHFQRHVIRELGLKNVRSLCGRVEDLDPEPCDVVVAQAMADFEQVVAWMKPWCKAGGTLAVPCSEVPPELSAAKDLPGVKRLELRSYRVPISEIERKVWLAKRD